MAEALGDVVAGALFQQLRLGVLSNNLANVSTVGFKKDQVLYEPLAGTPMTDEAAQEAIISLNGERFAANLPARTYTDFSQGHVMQTGNKFDVALNGKGFFSVEAPDGNTQYTRKGNFTVNEQNELCTLDGLPVLGEAGRIILQDSNITIDETGRIQVDGAVIDKLKIVDFEENSLIKAGEGLFSLRSEDIVEVEPENMFVQQGYVEQSNVNAVKMMTEMIDTLRGFETYQKLIMSLGETNSLAIDKVGEVV
jgi:flagellar basal-body rod protein FlgG